MEGKKRPFSFPPPGLFPERCEVEVSCEDDNVLAEYYLRAWIDDPVETFVVLRAVHMPKVLGEVLRGDVLDMFSPVVDHGPSDRFCEYQQELDHVAVGT